MASLKANRTAIRRARLAQEEAELRAGIQGLEERLTAHNAALADLDARISRLELLRLQKQNARPESLDLGLTGRQGLLKPR